MAGNYTLPLRAVIDTNLIIAARWKERSNSRELLEAVRQGRAVLLWSEDTQGEVMRILKKARPPAAFKELVESVFVPEYKVKSTPDINLSEDPADNKFLAAAVGGGADVIVSNDKHLLELEEVKGIPIVRPGEAVRWIDKAGPAW